MLMPNAKVLAYDTDACKNLCKQMAQLNNVSEKNKEALTADELCFIDFENNKTLIISDCEGYEKELFTNNNFTTLKTVISN